MFSRLFKLFIVMFLLAASVSFAQSSRWSIAVKSSYFGDQPQLSTQITAIDNPISFGMQLQFFPSENLALQYSVETMHGKTQKPEGKELNVQSSLAVVAYPIEMWRFRPYLTQGLVWGLQNNNSEATSRSSVYYEFGLGTEFILSGNLFSSFATKLYSDGLNYHGLSTSLSFGYRF
ncbi:MAG: hypothetical protein D6814_04985 [Calditrichaeota bacterium]|nr:MAG: hypothetical protein D6814_04985 [Calditrichota bacterium]